jgi:hypothetical protein
MVVSGSTLVTLSIIYTPWLHTIPSIVRCHCVIVRHCSTLLCCHAPPQPPPSFTAALHCHQLTVLPTAASPNAIVGSCHGESQKFGRRRCINSYSLHIRVLHTKNGDGAEFKAGTAKERPRGRGSRSISLDDFHKGTLKE